MALGTEIKLFTVGREVFIAKKSDEGIWQRRTAVVENVTRGGIHLRLTFGNDLITVNANDRKLCFTADECSYICGLLNGR